MTAREVDEKTLNLFWELKAEDKKKQKACINKLSGIIRGLLQNKKEKEVPDKAKYCINRLFKGLAAGSDSSRHGFYECLKTVVNSKHLLPVKYFQDAAKDQLHTTGVMTKNEVTDFKRGQILANRLIAESEKTGEEAVGSLVAEIAVVGSKKHTLASEAAKAVLAVFDKISASTFENEVWPSLQPLVCVPMEKQSATRFEIMFKCQERFPTLISLKVLRYTVGCSQLLGPETYPFLIKFLFNCDSPTFADSLYSRLEATDKLPEFIVAIKESLGNPGKADDEGLRSFILSVIRKGHPSILSEILCSSSLLELLTKKTKTNEKHLEKITSVVRGQIADSGEDIQWAVSKSLIKAAKEMRIGAQAFGMLQSLLPSLKEEVAKKTCVYLRKIVTDIENSPKDRILALNYLVKFMRSPSLRPNTELVKATVKKLVGIGYTSAAEGSKELSKAVREQIIKILEPPSSKVLQWCDVVSDAINLIANILPEDFFKSAKAKKDWENIVATLNELVAVEEKDSCQIIFVLVYANVALVLLEDAEVVDEIIEDLDKCLERSQKKMKKSKKRKSEVNEEEPAWVEVLTDLLLFMLGQEKSSLRNLCNVVWKLLIPHLTENAIKSVLDVLHFTSEDGKVYVLPDKKKDGNVSEEEEESSEDDEEDLIDKEIDEDEDTGGNDALIKLKLDLQKALGDNAALTDQESIDLDEVSDDVMQEMDSALGMAFKAHIATKPNKKPTKAEAKNTLARLHFKIRALDLVEIMLNQVTDSRWILMMLLAVSECYVEALKSPVQGELQRKLRNVLKLMKDWKPKEDSIELDSQLIREKLMQLITIATQSPSRASEVSEVLSPALGCILKIAQKAEISASETTDKKNGKHLKKAFRMIENFLEDYGTGKISVIPYNFVYKALTMAYKKRLELFTRLVDVCFNHGDIGKHKYLALMSILKKAVTLPDLVSEAIEAEDSPLSNICKFSSEMFLIAEFCKQEHSEAFDILNTILPKMKNVEKMKPILLNLENAVSQYQEKVTVNKDSRDSFIKLSAQLGVQYNKPKSEDRKSATPDTATTGKTKAQREKEKRNKKKIKKRQLKKKAKNKGESTKTKTASDMNGNADELNEKPRYTNSVTLNDEDSTVTPSKPNKKKIRESKELEEIHDVQGDKNPPQSFTPSASAKRKNKVSDKISKNETNIKEGYNEKQGEEEEEGKISTSSSSKKKKRRRVTLNGDHEPTEEADLLTSDISSTPPKKLKVSGKTPMKTPRK